MSMSAYPNHGYVVKLSEFLDVLERQPFTGDEKQALTELREMEEDGGLDEQAALRTIKWLCKGACLLAPDEVFHLSDEDYPCDLECGEEYVCWAQSSLFEITPKPALNVLKQWGIEPQDSAWATWG